MANKGGLAKTLGLQSKGEEGKGAVAASGHESGLAWFFEEAVKRIVLQNPRDAFYPLGGKHVFCDDDGVVLCVAMPEGIGIEQRSKKKKRPGISAYSLGVVALDQVFGRGGFCTGGLVRPLVWLCHKQCALVADEG